MPGTPAVSDLQNRALRMALAVTLGLALESLRGAMLPPLAPVIAIQLLAAAPRPPGARLIFVMLAVTGGAALFAYVVAFLTTDYAGLYAIGVGLLYLWGFYLAFRPATAMIGSLALTMSIVVTTMAAASTAVAFILVVELSLSVVIGFALVFLAHSVFPHRGVPAQAARPDADEPPPIEPLPRALLGAGILLPLHLYLTAEGVAAMVVLLTTATMLRQPGLAESLRYGLAFAAGNAAGASLAALNVLLLSLYNPPIFLIAITAASALLLASQVVRGRRHAAIFLPGFVAYTMLFGLTLSPLPLGDDVAVLARVLQIVGAALYVLAAASLFLPLALRRRPVGRDGALRTEG